MINLYDSGVYLVNGTEIVADGADAAAELKAKTGKVKSRRRRGRLLTGFWRSIIHPGTWKS